jgi:hypothetical protein
MVPGNSSKTSKLCAQKKAVQGCDIENTFKLCRIKASLCMKEKWVALFP